MSYICVYLGCNKNEIHVIDTVKEKDLDKFITKLGGNPKDELLKIRINMDESKMTKEEVDQFLGSYMELDCPRDVKCKIFKIGNYIFPGKIDCVCMKNYG